MQSSPYLIFFRSRIVIPCIKSYVGSQFLKLIYNQVKLDYLIYYQFNKLIYLFLKIKYTV
jgi:hypothetical protein